MPDSLHLVWIQIKEYLSIGCSVIPARDRDDENGKAKTPYRGWKKYQSQQITEKELYDELEQFQTSSIALICGKISGNIEVIDVDVKYRPGIDAEFFAVIKDIYPNLWSRLRIHKTPSGGYHIPYRILGQDAPRSKKIAGREATAEEKRKDEKLSHVHFLETRGEGGIIILPPSMGYSIFQHNDIPTLSWEERCSMMSIAESFTAIPKTEKFKPVKNKKQDEYYTENPFEDYNRRGDSYDALIKNGWTYVSRRGSKVWLTKPGGKKNDVHAAYFTDSNMFYCFTTAASFENEVSYTQSAILCHLDFSDDWKKLYTHLVEKGYGKIRKDIEEKLAKKDELPPNASDEAKEYAQQYHGKIKEAHPYGIFWTFDAEGAHISRELLYTVCEGLGFTTYLEVIYKKREFFLDEYSSRGFYDELKRYIKLEDGDEYIDVCNAYESFLQRSGKFTIERLPEMKQEQLIEDSRNVCYKFFKNCYVKIDKYDIIELEYNEFPEGKFVFTKNVRNRNFKYNLEYGIYEEFLELSLGLIDEHTKNIIGFLAHEYKDETTAYIIVLTEKCLDPKEGGGSGKNLFCSLFSEITSYISKPGANSKFDANFFQIWQGEKIFCISDVDKDFKFSFLKEPSSGNILWKRLWKNQEIVQINNTPKLVVLTNYSYEIIDGGLKRRIIGVEFTNYFTNCGGVDVKFGKHFTKDWDEEDFNKFDTYVVNCIQHWIRSGRKLQHMDLSASGWEKQFIQTHGSTIHDIINEYWSIWTERIFVSNDDFNKDMNTYYAENGITNDRFKPLMKNINRALQEWAARARVSFNGNVVGRTDGRVIKGKRFGIDLKNVAKESNEEEENPF